jgi:hypothetical protein
MYLLLFAILSHDAFMADVGEEKAFVDDDVSGVLVRGGVGGALIGVPFSPHVCLATLLLVVISFLLHVTVTCIWTFSNKVTRLTTPIAHPLGTRFVVLPLPLLEDLSKALDDKSHLLVVELGGVDWESTWCRLFLLFFRCFECNGLLLGSGGGALLQVDNMFGVFDHKFKAHKLANASLGDICLYLGSP